MSRDTAMKAALYATPVFLTAFADKLGDMLYNGQWPTWPPVVGCALAGTIGACLTLRAFFDGSVEREKNARIASDNSGPPEPIPPAT